MEQLRTLWAEHPYLVGGAMAVPALYFLHRKFSSGITKPVRPYCPLNTVLLYQFARGLYAPSLSPFPMKLEMYFRMANIPYINDFNSQFGPKGKIPWITYNGVDVSDSQFCVEYLNEKLGIDLNQGLSTEEKAMAKALQVLVDEHLYWTVVYQRWVEDKDMKMLQLQFDRSIRLFKGRVVAQLHGQGMGRHSAEEIKHITLTDLQALSDFLGTKPYMMGDRPTEVDCSVFGMVAQFVYQPTEYGDWEALMKDRFPNLVSYSERIKQRFWPDWDECITHGATREATK